MREHLVAVMLVVHPTLVLLRIVFFTCFGERPTELAECLLAHAALVEEPKK